jgi:NitT/TauT family transport system ATP-binding protein
MSLKLDSITKRFGELTVFKDLSLSFAEGEISVILGPSGCGKTTLLNIISGADTSFEGTLSLPPDFSASYLFQEPRLLPWKTVAENLEFVLPPTVPKNEIPSIIEDHLDLVNLREFANYYPGQLSGGMKQRAAMARAFSFPATTILMDEPLQGLDLHLQLKLTRALLHLWERERRTIIYVTHTIQEAVLLGDTIIVLSDPPAVKLMEIDVPIVQQERSLDNPKISEIERELYGVITKKTLP